MKVLNFDTTYDCFITSEELRVLRSSPLETDLLDRSTRKPLDKRVSLEVGTPSFGREADDVMVPEDASWDAATKIRLVISPAIYELVRGNYSASGRTSYGDIFVHVDEDEAKRV
jgi:hypothetical protein